ncbi:dihydropteroate synthase [Tumidithrix helvetica PCC 7403]
MYNDLSIYENIMTVESLGWQIGDRAFIWGKRTYLMGVLNVTPDSFSDGGLFDSPEAAVAQADRMAAQVDILDIGGESTRPGAIAIDAEQELARVIPVIEAIRKAHPHLPISIDTTKAKVAESALQAGANVINDVSAGRFDPDMLMLAGKCQVPLILMHMQGSPRSMQSDPQYKHVVREVKQFLADAISVAIACGLPKHLIAIDPGIGFGKTLEHNLTLLRDLGEFRELGCPMLVGVSRKSFIGKLCDRPNPSDRLWGTAAACTAAIAGGADILRVHDPIEIGDVCRVGDAIFRG